MELRGGIVILKFWMLSNSLTSKLALDFTDRFKNSVYLHPYLFEKTIGICQEFRAQLENDSNKKKYLAIKYFKNLSC